MESDEAVWQAALQPDGEAFGVLFDRHRDVVFRQVLRLVAQPADAEEVVAAAFFELWRKRAGVRLVEGSVLPWLLVTASNLAKNSRRALLRHESLLRRLPREDDDIGSVDAFERIDGLALRADLMQALRALKSQDMVLVTLTALEGYPVSEVAGLLGISDNAARVRLHRARGRLRVLLASAHEVETSAEEVTQ